MVYGMCGLAGDGARKQIYVPLGANSELVGIESRQEGEVYNISPLETDLRPVSM